MRRLSGVADDEEHVLGREIEDRQPVEDLAPGYLAVDDPGIAMLAGIVRPKIGASVQLR